MSQKECEYGDAGNIIRAACICRVAFELKSMQRLKIRLQAGRARGRICDSQTIQLWGKLSAI